MSSAEVNGKDGTVLGVLWVKPVPASRRGQWGITWVPADGDLGAEGGTVIIPVPAAHELVALLAPMTGWDLVEKNLGNVHKAEAERLITHGEYDDRELELVARDTAWAAVHALLDIAAAVREVASALDSQ